MVENRRRPFPPPTPLTTTNAMQFSTPQACGLWLAACGCFIVTGFPELPVQPIPMSEARKILVTSALPYANGSIHLGHMLEYIQTDMWVRFQKLRGNQCVYVCADDAHGSAIMLRAEKEGITPEQLIADVKAEHTADFGDFLVNFDNYHSTNSEENRELSAAIYLKLRDAGHIA